MQQNKSMQVKSRLDIKMVAMNSSQTRNPHRQSPGEIMDGSLKPDLFCGRQRPRWWIHMRQHHLFSKNQQSNALITMQSQLHNTTHENETQHYCDSCDFLFLSNHVSKTWPETNHLCQTNETTRCSTCGPLVLPNLFD